MSHEEVKAYLGKRPWEVDQAFSSRNSDFWIGFEMPFQGEGEKGKLSPSCDSVSPTIHSECNCLLLAFLV